MLERRLLIVTGKGGTGRSAATAALAIRAAAEGKRVLAVAMLEREGLGLHLGAPELRYNAAQVRPGLWAMAIDRSSALDEYLHVQLHAPRFAPLGPLGRALNVLADTVPGIRDIITVGKVIFETWEDQWDLVVADGPPLGQVTSYLRAPTVIAGLVPAGPVRDQAARMRALLEDRSAAGLVITTTPEELPVAETLEALEEVDAEQAIDVAAVVVNRMLEPLDVDEAALGDDPYGAAARLHLGLQREQELWRKRLPPGPALPHLFGLLTPGEVAARLAELWEDA